MTTLEVVFGLFMLLAIVLFVIALATPSGRARDFSYGFLLAAVLVLGLGGRVLH